MYVGGRGSASIINTMDGHWPGTGRLQKVFSVKELARLLVGRLKLKTVLEISTHCGQNIPCSMLYGHVTCSTKECES